MHFPVIEGWRLGQWVSSGMNACAATDPVLISCVIRRGSSTIALDGGALAGGKL